jgi:hypothetical protein
MSGRQLARLAAVFIGLLLLWGAAAVWQREGSASPAGGAFHLPRVDRARVDTVLLTKGGETTRLVRQDSSWTVNGHPASQTAVGDLLAALSDSTTAGELVAERRGSQAGLGTDSVGGTRLQVKAGGRTVADLIVGRQSPDLSGGYVRLSGRDSTWMIQSRVIELSARPVDDWRDRRIASVPSDQVGSLEWSHGARRLRLARAGSGWTLTPGGPADSSRVNDLLAAWRDVQASGFASAAQADSARFAPPDGRARVLGRNGQPLVTLLFDSTAAGWWVKPDTGTAVYLMESYGVDRLMPADSTLKPTRSASKH